MRIGVFGDVVGRAGRRALADHLPRLKRRLSLDFVVVNVENAAGGFGVTPSICEEMFDAGADVLTTGNHAYDQRDDIDLYDVERRLLRPANFPSSNPGRGSGLYPTGDGRNVLVVNLQGQRGMPPIDDPCAAIDRELDGVKLGREADAIIVDFHAEATSEKYSLGHYLDGRATIVVGTHTHVPTSDHQILSRGTAYVTDLGMCGDYDSVIGMEKSEPLHRFQTKMNMGRMNPASGEGTVCGLFIEANAAGEATRAEPIRIGGKLSEILPAAVG
ncbi:MAG: metallophosphoesterase [Alphaproteobacteria bacterium]|nr:metallophosphoesterase [Alphaproteobacteria bacterium]